MKLKIHKPQYHDDEPWECRKNEVPLTWTRKAPFTRAEYNHYANVPRVIATLREILRGEQT